MRISNKKEIVTAVTKAVEANEPVKVLGLMTEMFLNLIEAQTEAMEKQARAIERLADKWGVR